MAKWSIQPSHLCVVFLGMFAESYDLATVIEAARILQSRGRDDIRIILAGTGDRGADLQRRARDVRSVVFTGWLSRLESSALLARASVGLASYGRGTLQSLPYKPFEYMAHGLCVLNSLEGELEQLVTTNGMGRQYVAGDAQSLAANLAWCGDHRAETSAMGKNAQRLFEDQFVEGKVYSAFADAIIKELGINR